MWLFHLKIFNPNKMYLYLSVSVFIVLQASSESPRFYETLVIRLLTDFYIY